MSMRRWRDVKIKWNGELIDLRGVSEVFVEDPEDPGNYVASKIYVGETDPAVGGDVPYVWLQPSALVTPELIIVTRQTGISDTTTTGGTTYVQWGTQEVVFDHTLWAGPVTIEAHAMGYFTDVDLNEYVDTRLNISIDNGGTWTAGTPAVESRSTGTVTVDHRDSITAFQVVSGATPTGDIQVRAEIRTLTGSNQAEFRGGHIIATVRNAHASDN